MNILSLRENISGSFYISFESDSGIGLLGAVGGAGAVGVGLGLLALGVKAFMEYSKEEEEKERRRQQGLSQRGGNY